MTQSEVRRHAAWSSLHREQVSCSETEKRTRTLNHMAYSSMLSARPQSGPKLHDHTLPPAGRRSEHARETVGEEEEENRGERAKEK